MTIQERSRYKKKHIDSLIFAMDECNSMLFKDCMSYLIEIEIKEVERLKKKYQITK